MYERAMLRIGAVSFVAGLAMAIVFEILHPSREDPNNNPLVFAEYAQDSNWITVHLGQLAGALLLICGLLCLASSVALGPALAHAWARLAGAAAIVSAAAFGALQVVDGVALKRAVDQWYAASAEMKPTAFASALTARWTEYGLNSLTYSMVGLTLILLGVALLVGDRFPRWLGIWGMAAGVAFAMKGLITAYRGFDMNMFGLLSLTVFGTWALTMAVLMWRRAQVSATERPTARAESPAHRSTERERLP